MTDTNLRQLQDDLNNALEPLGYHITVGRPKGYAAWVEVRLHTTLAVGCGKSPGDMEDDDYALQMVRRMLEPRGLDHLLPRGPGRPKR